ncbi:tandem-type lipoprotein, partial [Staphylococcus sp. HMSC063D03]|uniref:tandem-type lipoprotein n=1 Tax=Staphylococcus sp. HMSC063D03 TaxID=1715009 RepID=UPI0009F31846
MLHSKKLLICLLILMLFIGGCGMNNKDNNREAQIKRSFNKMLSIYPTKNLEDFYDKEGFRDQEFDKNDKGTWIIGSTMVIEPKGKSMKTRGMVLYINRNTRTTTGNYILSEITEDKKGRLQSTEKRYPVKMEHNKIIPTKPINDKKLK